MYVSLQLNAIFRSVLLGVLVLQLVIAEPLAALGQAVEETEMSVEVASTTEVATAAEESVTATEIVTEVPTEAVTETPLAVATETITAPTPTAAVPTEASPTESVTAESTAAVTEESSDSATETPTGIGSLSKTSETPQVQSMGVAAAGDSACTLASPSSVVPTPQHVTYRCVSDKTPFKATITNMTENWQWSHSFGSEIAPREDAWKTTDFGPTQASGNVDTIYIYIRPMPGALAGSTASVNVTIEHPSGKDAESHILTTMRALGSSNFVVACTPNSITVATSATGTVSCSLSGINVAPSASVSVNRVTVSSTPGWTITRSPANGSLTGATPFIFSLALTPVCGATANPTTPNVAISTQLTFMSASFPGPATSITAKHGATSTVTTAIIGTSLDWSQTYSFAPQIVNGSVNYQVVASGCAGWTVQVSATEFTYSGTANGSPIASSNISVTPGAPTSTSGSATNVSAGAAGTLGAPMTVLSASANSGAGAYTQTLELGVTIPDGARVGNYTSILTIAAASGP